MTRLLKAFLFKEGNPKLFQLRLELNDQMRAFH